MKKKNLLLLGLAIIIYALAQQGGMNFKSASAQLDAVTDAYAQVESSRTSLHNAFVNGQSDVQIQGSGVVKKILPDDREGLQHQKFILQTSVNHTVLVAHNVGVAKRLPGLKVGDAVDFYGEYEWTRQGGVIHWTHRDTKGRHINGWLKYNGKTYQ